MLQEGTAAAVAAAAGANDQQQQQQQQLTEGAAGTSRRHRHRDRQQQGNNPQPQVQQQQQRNGVGGEPHDNRILILFDLNGVLTDHTPAREEGRYKVSTPMMFAKPCGSGDNRSTAMRTLGVLRVVGEEYVNAVASGVSMVTGA
jgi:hypothetical protein